MFQTSTALIALNSFANVQGFLYYLGQLRIQVVNKNQINTKETILFEAENQKPDYLIISSGLPGVIGLSEVIFKVKQSSPKTKIILLVAQNDSTKIISFLLANVDAIIWAENTFESFEAAVRQLSKGNIYICSRSTLELKALLQDQKIEVKNDLGLLGLLTDRELEVLYSLTQGINYKQISKLLFISESTVKTHINNIFTKLNVNDRTQAVLYGLKHGIESISKKPDLLKNLSAETLQRFTGQ